MDASSVLSDSDEYDVVSNPGQRSLDSSVADLADAAASAQLRHGEGRIDVDGTPTRTSKAPAEPTPLPEARAAYSTANLSAEEVQSYVRHVLDKAPGYTSSTGKPRDGGGTLRSHTRPSIPIDSTRTVRVYVDGEFDGFDLRVAFLLRQAKLAFPSVHLMVGVFADMLCGGSSTSMTPCRSHIERCELLRHCRWVDEILPDAPLPLMPAYLRAHSIDYVAIEEGASVDPAFGRERLRGVDELKRLGKVIPLRRTNGLAPVSSLPPASPYPSPASPPDLHARPPFEDTDAPFYDPGDAVEPSSRDSSGQAAGPDYLAEPDYHPEPKLDCFPVMDYSPEPTSLQEPTYGCKKKKKGMKKSSRTVAAEDLFRESPVM